MCTPLGVVEGACATGMQQAAVSSVSCPFAGQCGSVGMACACPASVGQIRLPLVLLRDAQLLLPSGATVVIESLAHGVQRRMSKAQVMLWSLDNSACLMLAL